MFVFCQTWMSACLAWRIVIEMPCAATSLAVSGVTVNQDSWVMGKRVLVS